MSNDTQTQLPVVAIVGRPNVGKSSLFNRILGRRVSIVHSISGVTRDRVMCPVTLEHHHFMLVDTGGLGVFLDDGQVEKFDELIREQVEAIIGEADEIIWIVDSNDGVTALDLEIARFLHEKNRTPILVANKADNVKKETAAETEFAELGFGPVLPVSCTQNRNVSLLLGRITDNLPEAQVETLGESGMRLAVVGRPNVGKSSLVNAMLGEKRVIVSDIAGTTRDAVDIPIELMDEDGEKNPLTLIDTAGLRQKRRVDNAVELFSVMRAENAVKRSDAVVLVLDGTDLGTTQDRRIARLIVDHEKPCILAVNKWDLAGKDMKMRDLEKQVRRTMPFMGFCPIVPLCAISGYRLGELLGCIAYLREQMQVKIPTSILNRFLEDVIGRNPPPAQGTKRLKIFYGAMVQMPPPRIKLFVNDKKLCKAHYRQFLSNQIRDAFYPETGLPIILEVRGRREGDEKNDGRRRAAAGAKREQQTADRAKDRHRERRKGWRKKGQ